MGALTSTIDGRARELVDAPNFCHVAVVTADGSPHVVPVWADTDGEFLYLNSARGRVWPSALANEPRVACTITNHDDPYEYVEIRGEVVEITESGADDHIDRLATKYLGEETYPFRKASETRVTIRIRPDRVKHYG